MSPETIVTIGGRRVVVDEYKCGEEVVVIPRVIMGESATKDLGKLFAGRAWVNYDPSKEFAPVVLREGTDAQGAINDIVAFLRANDSLWRLARQ